MATAFKQVKNNARSTVATAPSPATSGTSLVVASGEGAKFPTPGNGFWATVWNATTYPDPNNDTNREVVLVTGVSTDTFTITRAQLGTSARTITTADTIALLITDQQLTDVQGTINNIENGTDIIKNTLYGGQGGVISGVSAGQAALFAAGTSNSRPHWINESGIDETILTSSYSETIGYTQITSNFAATSTTYTQVTGLSTTVTVPSGGRKVRITLWTGNLQNNGANNNWLGIWDGTVPSGTLLAEAINYSPVANAGNQTTVTAVVTPSAGSKTYNAGIKSAAGQVTVTANANAPAYIMAELI